jgi:ATP-dependent RNA helicase DBP3
MQTQAVCDECAEHVDFKSICIYGGMLKYQQRNEIKAKINMVVATPGRLISLLRENEIDLSSVTYLVLDEADRLLDMGFEADIREIAGACKPVESRQTLLFSATWPETVQKFGHELVKKKYFRIDIGREPNMVMNEEGEMVVQPDRLTANNRITQQVFVFEDDRPKRNKLQNLMREIAVGKTKVIVFVLYRKEVPYVERNLRDQGYKVAALSSDYSQADRTAALQSFKDGKATVLVATDVAARGLDIPNVEHVVNYSFPLTIEDYVHRIGRTGRAGKTGNSWTFFTASSDKNLAGSLQNLMRESGQAENIPADLVKFGVTVKKRKEHGMYGNHFKNLGDAPMAAKKHIKFD